MSENGLRSISDIVQFCTQVEQVLRPHGLHVALTGSALYGMGTGKDVDILVYHHEGADTDEPAVVFERLIPELTFVQNIEPLFNSSYMQDPSQSMPNRLVWSGKAGSTRVDFIVHNL